MLGASVINIIALLSSDFLKLVGIAILIASPVGWWLGEKLLTHFAYHTSVQWWYFVIAGGMAVDRYCPGFGGFSGHLGCAYQSGQELTK